MRLLPLVCILSLCSAARADWQTFTVPGVPVHVAPRGPDGFVITTDQGVFELGDGGISRQFLFSGLAAGFVDGSGCLGGGTSSGGVLAAADAGTGACQYNYSVFAGAGQTLGTLASTSASTTYAPTLGGVSPEIRYSASTGTPTKPQWVAVSLGVFSPNGRASALRAGNTDYGLFTGTASAAPTLLLANAEQGIGQFRTDAGLGEIHLFEQSSGSVQAFNAPPAGGIQVLAFDGGIQANASWAAVPSASAVKSLSFENLPGTGEVFGLAVQASGVVLGAVPDSSPPRVGKGWVALTGALPGIGTPALVRCLGAKSCALVSAAATSPNVALYRNSSPPNAPASSNVSVDEAQAVIAAVTVADPDGDAVLINWSPAAAAPFSITPQPDGRSALIAADRTSGANCGAVSTVHAVSLTATDGLPGHVSGAGTLNVTVRHVIPPDSPALTPNTLSVVAGSAPRSFDAAPGAAGCAPTSYSAAMEPGSLAGVAVTGANPFTVSVPPTHCSLDAGVARVLVRGADIAGTSDAGVLTVLVQPWGIPDAPFGAGASVTQLAGTVGNYARDGGHSCQAAAGFPGVNTTWSLDAGSSVSGVVVSVGGTPLAAGPKTGPTLQVSSADTCAAGSVQVFASNETNGITGPTGALNVIIQPNPRPLADAGFTTTAMFQTGGSIAGTTDVPGLDCVPQRNLTVDLAVQRAQQTLIELSSQPLGAYTLQGVPLDCSGDSVSVIAKLRADGTPSGRTASAPVSIPPQPVGIGIVESPPLVARCGEPARGTIVLKPGPLDCATPAFALVPDGTDAGLDLRVVQLDGGAFQVETLETDFGKLLGKTALLSASADGGTGNTADRAVPIEFTAEPFVRVSHRQTPAVSQTPSPVSFVVELTNTSACDVSGVELVENLSGRAYVAGSARFAGTPALATLSDDSGRLTISGLALPAGKTVRLIYSARILPFTDHALSAEARIGSVLISLPAGQETGASAPSGCGCGAAGASTAWLGLLVLTLRARRRENNSSTPRYKQTR